MLIATLTILPLALIMGAVLGDNLGAWAWGKLHPAPAPDPTTRMH